MAAEVQPPGWLRGQVLLLPHVPRRGLHGVEAVLRAGPLEQVTRCFFTMPILSLAVVEPTDDGRWYAGPVMSAAVHKGL